MPPHKYQPEAFTGTPFNEAAAPLSRSSIWVGWGPYHVVDYYTDVIDEAVAIRATAAIEDKTPLAKTYVRGPDAERFVDSMQVRDASEIEALHANYTFWCDEAGHTVTEGLLFRIDQDTFCHMSAPLKDWCLAHADGFDVEIYDAIEAEEEIGVLCLQGPNSPQIMSEVIGDDLSRLGFSRGQRTEIAGAEVLIWRTGFTGEVGFEMWVPPEVSPAIFSVFVEKGAKHGAVPIGNAAQDIARVEAGMLISGTDYRPAGPAAQVQATYLGKEEHLHTPSELNFGRLVNLDSARDFVGRTALARERDEGPRRLLRGLVINWRDIVDMSNGHDRPAFLSARVHRDQVPDIYTPDGRRIGFATSVTWSPNMGEMVGFAHISAGDAASLGDVQLEWRTRDDLARIGARLVDLPFTKMRRRT